jgi:hypothetical protein
MYVDLLTAFAVLAATAGVGALLQFCADSIHKDGK